MYDIPVHQPVLYHYTCRHRAEQIITDLGRLQPAVRLQQAGILRVQPGAVRWISQLIWLTSRPDRSPANADSFGATVCSTDCEHGEIRFRVLDDQDVYPWAVLRSTWPGPIVKEIETLAAAAGDDTDDWWVSGGEVWVAPSLRLTAVPS